MKKFLLLSVAAAFAATPALAQTSNDSPYPNKNTPGSGAEQRDDNVVDGAKESSDGNILMDEGRSSTDLEEDTKKPGIETPGSGSEKRDENRLPQ